MKKIEDFYRKAGGKEYNKEGKKEKNFTYHDMIGFANAYHSKQLVLADIAKLFTCEKCRSHDERKLTDSTSQCKQCGRIQTS